MLLRRLLCLLRCRDGYAALSARLRGLQWDLGRGFETQLQLGPQEVRVRYRAAFPIWEADLSAGCLLLVWRPAAAWVR